MDPFWAVRFGLSRVYESQVRVPDLGFEEGLRRALERCVDFYSNWVWSSSLTDYHKAISGCLWHIPSGTPFLHP